MEAKAAKPAPKLRLPQGAKLGVKVGKRGQSTKIQRKRKLIKLEKVSSVTEATSTDDLPSLLLLHLLQACIESHGKSHTVSRHLILHEESATAGALAQREGDRTRKPGSDEDTAAADCQGPLEQQQGKCEHVCGARSLSMRMCA